MKNIFKSFRNFLPSFKQSAVNQIITQFIPMGSHGISARSRISPEQMAEEGYAQAGIVFACVNEIATAVAGVPWQLKRRVGDDVEEVFQHPLIDILRRPNESQGQSAFFEEFAAHYFIWGNTFMEIASGETGPPRYLYNLRRDRVSIKPNTLSRVGGYIYKVNGRKIEFDAEEVLHFKSFNPTDDWFGMSPLQPGGLAVDSYKNQLVWNLSLTKNDGVPSVIFNYEEEIEAETKEKMEADLLAKFGGPTNKGRAMVSSGGKMDIKTLGFNARELDFVNSMSQTALQVCQIYNMPPELVGLTPATYQNRKEARKALYTEVVIPFLDRLKSELNNFLVPKFEQGGKIFLDYNKSGIEALAEDQEALWERVNNSKELTINEKRNLKGFDDHDDGDVIFVQASEIPLADALDPFGGEELKPDKPKAFEDFDFDEEESVEQKIRNKRRVEVLQVARMRKKYITQTQKKINRLFLKEAEIVVNSFKQFGIDAIDAAVDSTNREWEETIAQNMLGIMKAFGDRALKQIKFNSEELETKDLIDDRFSIQSRIWARKQAGDEITRISETTKKKVRKELTESVVAGEPVDVAAERVFKTYKGFTVTRSRVIALTETVSAQNQGGLEAMRALDFPVKKIWLWSGITGENERSTHRAMDGKAINENDQFNVDGDLMDAPGDPTASAENRVNCQCTLGYERDVEQ